MTRVPRPDPKAFAAQATAQAALSAGFCPACNAILDWPLPDMAHCPRCGDEWSPDHLNAAGRDTDSLIRLAREAVAGAATHRKPDGCEWAPWLAEQSGILAYFVTALADALELDRS